jgi:hypothetical protein
MSEERFGRIETRLDELAVGQAEMRGDISQLRGDVTELRGDVTHLRGDVTELLADLHSMGVQMRVLHEDVIANIKAIPDQTANLQRAPHET